MPEQLRYHDPFLTKQMPILHAMDDVALAKTANQIARPGHGHLYEVTDVLTRAWISDRRMDEVFPDKRADPRPALMQFPFLVQSEAA